VLFSSRVRVTNRSSVWLDSGYAHVFVLLFVFTESDATPRHSVDDI